MYPPTDFTDFLQRVQSGAYTNPQGLSILQRVVGMSADQADLSLPLVGENSFPLRVASEGSNWPPMLIVQGSADELVEARQSVRLCDALAGRVLPMVDEEVGEASELRDVVQCGTQTTPVSQLHLIKQGDHALDVCINENVPDLCQSGSAASRSLVSQSISDSLIFSVAAHQSALDGADATGDSTDASGLPDDSTADTSDMVGNVSTGGGGGASSLFLLFSLLLLNLIPKRRQTLQ